MSIEAIKRLVAALEYHTAQTRPITQTQEAIAAGKALIAQMENQDQIRAITQEAHQKIHYLEDEIRRKVYGITAIEQAEKQEPVATVRTWHKNGDQHAELADWELGLFKLPDGEHTLYTTPPAAQEEIQRLSALVRAQQITIDKLETQSSPVQEPTTTESNGGKTGWPPGLLQDDNSRLSKWFAGKPDARQKVREAAEPVQEPKQSEIFCGVDFADGVLSVSVLRRRPDEVAELLHSEQIQLQPPAAPVQEPVAWMGTDIEGNPNKFRLNPFNGGVALYKKPQSVKVWDAEGYDALMQELELWKAAAQRQWVTLTDDVKQDMATDYFDADWAVRKALQLIDEHEAKLREKNT